jgi:hypothetical protein
MADFCGLQRSRDKHSREAILAGVTFCVTFRFYGQDRLGRGHVAMLVTRKRGSLGRGRL